MEIWELLLIALGPTGGAWVGVKGGLNGMKERQTKMDRTLDRIDETVAGHSTRLAVIETKLED